MKPETLTLLLALGAFLLFFGPAIARVVLRPERGSMTDLRIAQFEALVIDLDKSLRIREKIKARLEAQAGELLPPSGRSSPTIPPSPPASPPASPPPSVSPTESENTP